MQGPGERSFGKVLGPGLLFAGTAVGVSHLVQATTAGAVYGLGLLGVIIAANVIKYPAFSFGPRFAAATGTSLLEGYRRQGRWALAVYGVLTLVTMFTVEAAVTLVTAALFKALLGGDLSLVVIAALVFAACAAICAIGKFAALDLVIKVVVVALTLSTLVATALAIGRVDFSSPLIPRFSLEDRAALLWLAALIGWMPSAIDVSVWHSLWTLAKRRQTGYAARVKESLLDFKVGYWGSAALAVCFGLLGAGILHGSGREIPTRPVAFANMLLDLYGETLGGWARTLIGACAALVMFSTTLAVVDGFPRAISVLVKRWSSAEEPGASAELEKSPLYWGTLVALAVGGLVLIKYFLADLATLLTLATTISFLTAPILALLNHRAITSEFVPSAHRPGAKMVAFSLFSIVVMTVFAVFYATLKLG